MKNLSHWLSSCLNGWSLWRLSLLIFLAVFAFVKGVERGRSDMVMELQVTGQIECGDTPSRTGWLAVREGEYRCFHEHRQYPHRARGATIISDTFYERVASWHSY